MIIKDLFLYVAAFVPKEALRDFFQFQGDTPYAALKTAAIALPDTRVQSGVKALVFGIDDESVRQRISSIGGMYLFAEYGQCTSYIDAMDVKTDKMHLALTVAESLPDDADQAQQLLSQDRTLEVTSTIRRAMRSDYDLGCLWLPAEASTLTPFRAKGLANSFGWTLEWNTAMTDLI